MCHGVYLHVQLGYISILFNNCMEACILSFLKSFTSEIGGRGLNLQNKFCPPFWMPTLYLSLYKNAQEFGVTYSLYHNVYFKLICLSE